MCNFGLGFCGLACTATICLTLGSVGKAYWRHNCVGFLWDGLSPTVCLIGWDVWTAIAITMTGKRTWSHPALPVWVGGRGIVIGKWLLVIGQCNRALAGITFFPISNK